MKLELKDRKLYCADLKPPVLIAEFNDELIHDAEVTNIRRRYL